MVQFREDFQIFIENQQLLYVLEGILWGNLIQGGERIKIPMSIEKRYFTKRALKSTAFELQKCYRYQKSCLIDFQKNDSSRITQCSVYSDAGCTVALEGNNK